MIRHLTRRPERKFAVLLLALIGAFGLWGCDSGGDGASTNYGRTVNFSITGGSSIAGLDGNVTVYSTSGEVGELQVNGDDYTVEVSGITENPAYLIVAVDLDSYVPLLRSIEMTPFAALVDESGDNFTYTLLASGSMPAGGATGDSNASSYDPSTGTQASIGTPTPVEAATNYSSGIQVPAGAFFNGLDGNPASGQISLALAYHEGSSNQEPYYPNGSYDGSAPAAFGTVSFRNGQGDFVVPQAGTRINLAFSFEGPVDFGAGDAMESLYVTATATTSACLTQIATGQSMKVQCEDTGSKINCDDIDVDIPGQAVQSWRVDFPYNINPGCVE